MVSPTKQELRDTEGPGDTQVGKDRALKMHLQGWTCPLANTAATQPTAQGGTYEGAALPLTAQSPGDNCLSLKSALSFHPAADLRWFAK